MGIKKFECGLCSKDERFSMTRHGLRKHLRVEHSMKRELTNSESLVHGKQVKQNWWIEKEF